MPRATGSFQILSGNEDSYEKRDGGARLAHAWGDQAFSGDITGDGNVHWLISYAADRLRSLRAITPSPASKCASASSGVMLTTGTFRPRPSASAIAFIGTPSAGPIADNWDNPKWKTFVAAYKKAYPNGFPSPSLFAHGYYVEALAMMQALDTVHGDLSDGQKAFRDALASETVDTPTGMVKLDKNRNAVADIFLTEVAQGEDGNLYNKVVKVVPGVNQRLGMSKAEFDKVGLGSRDVPNCP